jgi:Asp-tRNA(Asn)/Glu-tRNA(Gln) amidotransferase A subunit family amidase
MSTRNTTDRRSFLECFARLGLSSTLYPGVLWAQIQQTDAPRITKEILRQAAAVAGMTFTEREFDTMLEAVNLNIGRLEQIRKVPLENAIAPPLYFNPLVPGMKIDRRKQPRRPSTQPRVTRPRNLEDVAFWTIPQLASLIRTRQVKSTELTEMYFDRLKRYNPKLNCVVTLTEERARRQSRDADREIAAGRYRGPLHGIPWGAKDLLAVKGYPTTWGAAPFKDRVIDEDATVVSRLDAAGAVLVAKLSTGELAVDDVWFGGQTLNPWDLSMGSQGSSAGPGAATAAGLVGFSIGTETLGSILAPSGICGVTGLRPTFGRVSRHGVMTLSWTLDKIGPICRAVEDCAIVLMAIQGPDDRDMSLQDLPFNWDASQDARELRVGYLKAAFSNTRQTAQTDANDGAALEKLRMLGVSLIPIDLPEHASLSPRIIQWAEMNAALKDPFQTRPREVLRQDRVVNLNAARFVTATDYLEANRIRGLLMREMARILSGIDVYVSPFDYADYTPNAVATLHTSVANLTGQPSVIVPHGFNEKGNPTSLTFTGGIFGEAGILALAKAYQDATDWHRKHPNLFA